MIRLPSIPHIFIKKSLEHDTINYSEGENLQSFTKALCPNILISILLVSKSHNLTEKSYEEDKIFFPSDEKFTLETASSCPSKVFIKAPEFLSQISIVSVTVPETIKLLSRENLASNIYTPSKSS